MKWPCASLMHASTPNPPTSSTRLASMYVQSGMCAGSQRISVRMSSILPHRRGMSLCIVHSVYSVQVEHSGRVL
ncbi:hypothetical protein VNO78_01584 [Psophocarpus tetragonolobus]|uniref:Uncharacterized protein n=1 Tax=Psophocarpus tetragonolobus TaxID=3891 RepID=A0AAN9XVL2_PSOTE